MQLNICVSLLTVMFQDKKQLWSKFYNSSTALCYYFILWDNAHKQLIAITNTESGSNVVDMIYLIELLQMMMVMHSLCISVDSTT